jgi:UDPglucose--hexose-1-phosphate uridylyltransferase
MSEIRLDPTTEEWVIFARIRADRPTDLVNARSKPELPVFSASCPFCPGNESMTPPEITSYKNPQTGNWQIRVIENKFPVLTPAGNTTRTTEDDMFTGMDGLGVHEVVVETPEHNRHIVQQDDNAVTEILRTYLVRYNVMKKLPFVKLIIIYKNYGIMAGTTLEHSHSQLLATPVISHQLRMQSEVASRYYDDKGRCLYCDIVERELEAGKRIIMETDSYIVFHPFASHSPFETWIVPKNACASFGNLPETELPELARVLRLNLLKLYKGLNNPDFNYVINSAPVDDEDRDYFRWHIRIIPRLTEMTGFEIGTGINMNTLLPENTAAFIRNLAID